jgi:hypothetical protein
MVSTMVLKVSPWRSLSVASLGTSRRRARLGLLSKASRLDHLGVQVVA